MPVLLGHPHLLLREALQLIAITERMTNKINKARFTFFIKILRFGLWFNKFERATGLITQSI